MNPIKLIDLNNLTLRPNIATARILRMTSFNAQIDPADETYLLCGTAKDGILYEESMELFLEKSGIEISEEILPSFKTTTVIYNGEECEVCDKILLIQNGKRYVVDIVYNTACCDRSQGDQAHIDFNTIKAI